MILEAKIYELVDFLHRIDLVVFREHISAKLYKYHALVRCGD
jgi:hypothetical protein